MASLIFNSVYKLFLHAENALNKLFSDRYNPLYWLGAVSIFFLWLLLVTGIYLFIFYKMSPDKAYDSIEYLTVDQWYLGGFMRSIHRYATDGLMISILLHMLNVFFKDKFAREKWLAWVSGIVLILVTLFEGVSGYWLIWDKLAQVLSIYTAEFIDILPIFGEPLTRAFSSNSSVTGLFFFILLGMHCAVPIFGMIFLMIHITRISRAKINPPALLGWGLFGSLTALSIISPAVSGPRADFTELPGVIGVDWFYLFYLPMLQKLPVWQSWVVFFAALAFLFAIPWMTRRRGLPVAVSDLDRCAGCGQCFEDCPYEAIKMEKHKENDVCPYCGDPREKVPVINAKKCASCSICVGSCDYKAMSYADWSDSSIRQKISDILGGARKKKGQILGAHMIGPEVTELLAELSMTKLLEGTTTELGWLVHPHPTISETLKEAALDSNGEAIHI